jgi:hypothetical protein
MKWPVILVLMFYAAVAACSLFIIATSTLVDKPPRVGRHL